MRRRPKRKPNPVCENSNRLPERPGAAACRRLCISGLVDFAALAVCGLEGGAIGNLGVAYANLGEVQKATALLQQAKAIGEQIGDPHIVEVTTRALEKLSDG